MLSADSHANTHGISRSINETMFAMRNHPLSLTNASPLRRQRRRGSALVEFALVLGLLLAIIMGVIEFSAYGRKSLAIANASREGARIAATGATISAITDRVVKSAPAGSVVSPDGSVTVDYSTDGGASYRTLTNNAAGTENAASPDNLIRVRVESFNHSITGIFGPVFNRKLHTEVTMRRERKSS